MQERGVRKPELSPLLLLLIPPASGDFFARSPLFPEFKGQPFALISPAIPMPYAQSYPNIDAVRSKISRLHKGLS